MNRTQSLLFPNLQEPAPQAGPPPPPAGDARDRGAEAAGQRRSAEAFAQFVAKAAQRPVRLTVTRNRVRFLSFRFEGEVCLLRVNRHVLDADEAVLLAVAEWIRHPRRGCPDEMRAFIASCETPPGPRRTFRLVTRGMHHDLEALRQEVNDAYFGGKVDAAITWGARAHKRRVRVRRLGAYRYARNLIVIHRVLDRRETPSRFIAYVIYHEMLHALQDGNHKRPHDRAFREALERHPDHEWAVKWERRNLRLLGLH